MFYQTVVALDFISRVFACARDTNYLLIRASRANLSLPTPRFFETGYGGDCEVVRTTHSAVRRRAVNSACQSDRHIFIAGQLIYFTLNNVHRTGEEWSLHTHTHTQNRVVQLRYSRYSNVIYCTIIHFEYQFF